MDNYFTLLFLMLGLASVALIPGLLVIFLYMLENKLPKITKYIIPLFYLIVFTLLYFSVVGCQWYIMQEHGDLITYYFSVEFAITIIICLFLDFRSKLIIETKPKAKK